MLFAHYWFTQIHVYIFKRMIYADKKKMDDDHDPEILKEVGGRQCRNPVVISQMHIRYYTRTSYTGKSDSLKRNSEAQGSAAPPPSVVTNT